LRPKFQKGRILEGCESRKLYNIRGRESQMKRALESKRDNAAALAGLAASLGAVAVGAVAIGAVALGAVAIGRLAIRRMLLGDAKIKSLEIEELSVRRLHVSELDVLESLKLPPSASLKNVEWE
jgi:hypothetical protein